MGKSDMLLLGSAATVVPQLVEAVEREISRRTAPKETISLGKKAAAADQKADVDSGSEDDSGTEKHIALESDKPSKNGRPKRALVIKKPAVSKKPAAQTADKAYPGA